MSDASISQLLAAVYDAAGQHAAWADPLDRLVQAVGGCAATMFVTDGHRHMPDGFAGATMVGHDPGAAEPYAAYYLAKEVRFAAAARLALGQVYADDRHIDWPILARTEIQTDFYAPRRLGHCAGITLLHQDSRMVTLSVHRALGDGGYTDAGLDLLTQLGPHLVRAVQLNRQIALAEARAGGLALALGHFPMAVFVVDSTGVVHARNQAAEALLAQPDSPLRIAGRQLRGTHTPTAALLRALFTPPTIRLHTAPPRILRLPRPAMAGTGPGHVDVMAVPVPPRLGTLAGHGLSLLFVSDLAQPGRLDVGALRRQLDLSAAEAHIAAALFAGDGMEAIAATRGVSRHTVRTQMKSLLAKLHVHSQTELVSRLCRSLARLV